MFFIWKLNRIFERSKKRIFLKNVDMVLDVKINIFGRLKCGERLYKGIWGLDVVFV